MTRPASPRNKPPMTDETKEDHDVLLQIRERGREGVLVSKGNGILQGFTLAGVAAVVVMGWNVRDKLITTDDIDPAVLATKDDLKELAARATEDLTLRLEPIKAAQESSSREMAGFRAEIQAVRSDPVPAWLLDRIQRIERDVEAAKAEGQK